MVINPVILSEKGEQCVDEGCLSFPNQFGKVKRPKELVVEGLDLNKYSKMSEMTKLYSNELIIGLGMNNSASISSKTVIGIEQEF